MIDTLLNKHSLNTFLKISDTARFWDQLDQRWLLVELSLSTGISSCSFSIALSLSDNLYSLVFSDITLRHFLSVENSGTTREINSPNPPSMSFYELFVGWVGEETGELKLD